MSRARDFLQALAAVLVIGIAQAACTDADDYAPPTKADIERDIQTQRAHLCAAEGWPADSKIAYERACKGDLRRKST
jgi:nitrous oxide reductase accessory protein NosL